MLGNGGLLGTVAMGVLLMGVLCVCLPKLWGPGNDGPKEENGLINILYCSKVWGQ